MRAYLLGNGVGQLQKLLYFSISTDKNGAKCHTTECPTIQPGSSRCLLARCSLNLCLALRCFINIINPSCL